jgi:hypothetical protein
MKSPGSVSLPVLGSRVELGEHDVGQREGRAEG